MSFAPIEIPIPAPDKGGALHASLAWVDATDETASIILTIRAGKRATITATIPVTMDSAKIGGLENISDIGIAPAVVPAAGKDLTIGDLGALAYALAVAVCADPAVQKGIYLLIQRNGG